MSRNKYGAKSLAMRKADSMRNPAYVSLPKGSMKNKSILSTLSRVADAGIGRYSVRNEKPSAMLSMKTIDRLAESVSPLILMQMFKDKMRPAKTSKRMSSVRKADYFVNNAPSKTQGTTSSGGGIIKPKSSSSMINPKGTPMPTLPARSSTMGTPMPTLPARSSTKGTPMPTLPAYMVTPSYEEMEARASRMTQGNAKETVTPPARTTVPISSSQSEFREYSNPYYYMKTPTPKPSSVTQSSVPSYINYIGNSRSNTQRNPYYEEALRPSIPLKPNGVTKRKTSTKRKASVRKADSMRNPEYVNIRRAPAVERMKDKVRARVNRTIGSNPLESVLEILQGKDTRNMINAQRNRNDYYRRKGDEISANYAREKRIPEYTRLPKGSAVPNMTMRAKETLSRIGAGTSDPAQRLMAILQSPSVIARFFEESQGKGKK